MEEQVQNYYDLTEILLKDILEVGVYDRFRMFQSQLRLVHSEVRRLTEYSAKLADLVERVNKIRLFEQPNTILEEEDGKRT